MAGRLVIAIDCDDVLMPTAHAIIQNYNSRFGTSVELKHFYEYGTVDKNLWGTVDPDEVIERINDFLRSEEHADLVPYPEAITAIRDLALDHELHLVSGRVDFLRPVTQRMLDLHFPGHFASIEHTNFVVPSTSTVQKRSKGDVCRTIGADILIDDHIRHGENALEANISKVLLFGDYPWNQVDALPERMVRCKDWTNVLEEVAAHAT